MEDLSQQSDKQSREKILKAIQQLKKNPQDKLRILGEVGIVSMGAAGAGAVALIAGASAAPIGFGLTALTGLTLVVAAPAALVAGSAIAGGIAAYGVAKIVTDGARQEEKLRQIRIRFEEALKDIEEKERSNSLTDQDKTNFILFLEEPLRLKLISGSDAEMLITMVESGQVKLSEAYQQINALLSEYMSTRQQGLAKWKPK